MNKKVFSIGFFLILSSCGAMRQESGAFLKEGPPAASQAQIGKTVFECQATFSQFRGSDELPLALKTQSKKTTLSEKEKLILLSNDFKGDDLANAKTIADSRNINNLRLIVGFSEESSLGCDKEEAELQITIQTVFAPLERNTTTSNAFCWNKSSSSLAAFVTIFPGPPRKTVGPRQTSSDDFDVAGFDDDDAISAKFVLRCKR